MYPLSTRRTRSPVASAQLRHCRHEAAGFRISALSDVACWRDRDEQSDVELEQFRAEYREAMAAKGSSKKKTTPNN